jgi:hypothetical protein
MLKFSLSVINVAPTSEASTAAMLVLMKVVS